MAPEISGATFLWMRNTTTGGLPISSIEGDGINDEQNGNRRRHGEQRSHFQKSTFNY
jgi:hypothetical protein